MVVGNAMPLKVSGMSTFKVRDGSPPCLSYSSLQVLLLLPRLHQTGRTLSSASVTS